MNSKTTGHLQVEEGEGWQVGKAGGQDEGAEALFRKIRSGIAAQKLEIKKLKLKLESFYFATGELKGVEAVDSFNQQLDCKGQRAAR